MKTVRRFLAVFVVLLAVLLAVSGSVTVGEGERAKTARANCIPEDEDIFGCVPDAIPTFRAWCEGYYFVMKDPQYSDCGPGKAQYTIYACNCQFVENRYRCPNGLIHSTYDFLFSRTMAYIDNQNCYPPLVSTVSFEVATNEELCRQWCSGKAQAHQIFLPLIHLAR